MADTALVFPASPDWSDPFEERATYFTDVMRPNGASEQRLGLRTMPRPVLTFSLSEFERRNVVELESLYWVWSGRRWAIPYWPDAAPLTAPVAPDDTALALDTSQRAFAADADILLWRDQRTFEVATVDTVGAGSLTLKAGVASAWPGDGLTLVVPVMYGRQTDDADLAALIRDTRTTRVTFECEPFIFPTGAWAETYAGFDVLAIEPNRDGQLESQHERRQEVFDSKTGSVATWQWATQPVVTRRAVPYVLQSRADIASFRAFRANRIGQLKPFWTPSWNDDLSLAATVAAGSTAATIQATGYTDRLFPSSARRYLCIFAGGQHYIRKVTASAYSEDLATETITLDAALPVALVSGNCMISFLTLCRLAADDSLWRWHTTSIAEFVVDMIEVPREVPA